ncbi:MAG: ribose-phosphate pyrophosphokinase-like domain-containing protein, partial [Clostridia bacterium]|nr:ribose-phosphate pyrophosphokinase-like domain-containing protein [Clostridia bacterium]
MAANSHHGKMGLIVMQSCTQLGAEVDQFIKQLRNEEESEESYIIPIQEIRFSNGEGKVKINDSVRGRDIYILCDIGNYSCTYNLYGHENFMSPDEHYRDIKRVLSAINGKADRITVLMPLLYSSRQHKRKGRESLDCAMALEELQALGVDCILTFDAHDPTICNAIPSTS